jgi:ATP-dependent Lon protease
LAMTGEITLRGRVLPIGGLKEKILAAHRGNIKTVIIPKDNEKDVAEVPQNVQNALEIIFVEHIDEVLDIAFVKDEKDGAAFNDACVPNMQVSTPAVN